jgi:hypothetical protein
VVSVALPSSTTRSPTVTVWLRVYVWVIVGLVVVVP